MIYRAGSLVFTSDRGFLSTAIKAFQREKGEPMSWVSHVGMVVKEGALPDVGIIEALTTVKIHPLIDAYGGKKTQVAIFDPVGFSGIERRLAVKEALKYHGRKYGYLKILAHAADRALGSAYFFRRLCRIDKYPICSWVTPHAYAKIGYLFLGRQPEMSQPDDQWDDVLRSERWKCTLPLQRI
jgi:hypothetical protein